MGLVYAIDFGTSNSLLAAAEPGRVHAPIPLDPDAPDPTILRSVIYFPSMKEAFYGARAITEFQRHEMTGRLIRSIKKHLPVRSFIGTWVEDRPVNLEDVIGFFLREMRRRANEHFQADVESVVLGRPARFSADDADDAFAQYRLERSARNAGFKHIAFRPEPLAAAYEFRTRITEPKTVLVGDFGGGTSDFTVIRISPASSGEAPSQVLAIGGVPLAGDALDGALMRRRVSRHFGADVRYVVPFGSNVLTMPTYLMDKLCSPADLTVLRKRDVLEFFRNVRQWSLGVRDKAAIDQLFTLIEDQLGFQVFEEIERVKKELSSADRSRFAFAYPGVSIEEDITRADFDGMTEEQVGKILGCLDETVRAAQVSFEQIDLVCSTGGTAKVAAIHEGLVRRFGHTKVMEHNHFHSVARGLAECAREISFDSV